MSFLDAELMTRPHGLQDYALGFRVLEEYGEGAIGHIPDLLYHRGEVSERLSSSDQTVSAGRNILADHFKRVGVEAEVTDGLLQGSYFVQYRHAEQPLVSIIVPTKDRLDLLKPCIESLIEKTAYP